MVSLFHGCFLLILTPVHHAKPKMFLIETANTQTNGRAVLYTKLHSFF